MPVLEEDGKQLSQSLTIFRYLGRKFGLGAADEFQNAKCNEYIDAVFDVRMEVFKLVKEDDEAKKAAITKNIQDNTFPKAWQKFNDIIKKNGSGVLVGPNVTYADIYVAFMVDWLTPIIQFQNMADYPELVAHGKKILGLPGIKEWIEKRPVTQF